MSANVLLVDGKINPSYLPLVAVAPSALVVASANGTLVYNPDVNGTPTPGAPSLTVEFTAPYTGLYNLQVDLAVPNGTRSALIDDAGLIQFGIGGGTATTLPAYGSIRGIDLAQASSYQLATNPVRYCFTTNAIFNAGGVYTFEVYAYRGNTPSGVWNLPGASAYITYVN